MISHGDILEQPGVGRDDSARALLRRAREFVVRQSGLGDPPRVSPQTNSRCPRSQTSYRMHSGHVRRLSPSSGAEDLRSELRQIGLFGFTPDAWLKGPKPCAASLAVAASDRALDVAPPSRDIRPALDPTKPVRYFTGDADRAKDADGPLYGAATAGLRRRSLVLRPTH